MNFPRRYARMLREEALLLKQCGSFSGHLLVFGRGKDIYERLGTVAQRFYFSFFIRKWIQAREISAYGRV